MKRYILAASIVATAAALVAAGHWWGANYPAPSRAVEGKADAKAGLNVLYFRNPMAPAETSPVPTKAANGMDFVPVYADTAVSPRADKPKGKVLYYRNPMGLADTSPVPKKDQMGMDYIAVYADEEEGPAAGTPLVKLTLDKVQKLGVKTEAVTLRSFSSTLRVVATVQPNERSLHTVTSKFDGWIQKLYVNTTGQAVRRGEALMDVYSPDLITAQQEYLIARKGVNGVSAGSPEVRAGMQRLVDGALQRLRNWDISETELQRLEQNSDGPQYLTLRSPANGVVLDKPSIQGKRFMAGEVLYQIADLSTVWLLAEVFEQDLAKLHVGQPAQIKVDAYPDKIFSGTVTFVYPTIAPETRTAKVRIELANPQALLKPSMYTRVELESSRAKALSLTVPDSAVLDTGTRQLVLVQRGEGRFEPRPVKLGKRGDSYIEVLDGVNAGEMVVVGANFLIDAESNLKAAFSGFGQSADRAKPAEMQASKAVSTPVAPAVVTHHGEGSVEAVDPAHSGVTLAHDPIASLKWPAMTMDFKVKDPVVLRALKPGQRIQFDMLDGGEGEWVIVRVQPAAAKTTNLVKPAADTHRGH